MALGSPQQITNSGVTPSFATPAASDSFTYPSNAHAVWMEVKNASGASITVTVTSQATAGDGLAASDKTVTVPATTGDKAFRISGAFKDGSDAVSVSFSATTSVTAGVFYV